MTESSQNRTCGASPEGCQRGVGRREFLGALGLGAAGALTSTLPVMAGPFEGSELVPADKKLRPEWVRSLTARGDRTVYRGAELEKIGMPIGGICTGQLYLGGDGRLWRWDIFNQRRGTGDAAYAHPPKPDFPVEQGFALQVTAEGKTVDWPLAAGGFSDIRFTGEYPIGYVEYRDAKCPVAVSLEAFSPFIPLDPEDSHLPVTVMRFTVKNTSQAKVACRLTGWLQNAVCLHSGKPGAGQRENRIVRAAGLLFLDCSAVPAPPSVEPTVRPEIVFEDFQKETYEGWEVTGVAFGKGPVLKSAIPSYQGDVGSKGPRVVNSHAMAPGKGVGEKDDQLGTLTSKPFTIERNFINFWIGGGNHPGKTCVQLLVDGKVVLSATGHDNNRMRRESFDVRKLAGKTARLQIVDQQKGPWGNIGCAEIVFSDKPVEPSKKLDEQEDFGTMGLGLLDPQPADMGVAAIAGGPIAPARGPATASASMDQKLVGTLGREISLEPGQQAVVTFVVAWHFPNIQHLGLAETGGRKYGKRFKSAREVTSYLAEHFEKLAAQTRLWHDTWYDSTLPYWFLDRTFLNISILATNTAYWFANNRFYGWEGVGCCQGTCTHVWHYAQAMSRIFPGLERNNRETVDYGVSFHPDTGVIGFRGEFDQGLAVDGQSGTILRTYREYQMSPDASFLKRNWPKIRKAIECLIRHDPDQDGILDGAQMNTLDQPWFGKVSWLSSIYVAALRAGRQMAIEMGDEEFARRTESIAAAGSRNIDQQLFNGEYYQHVADLQNRKTVGSFDGCEIDQVLGQSWAFQVGLPRVLPEEHTRTALRSLWKYNFAPDVGPFRKAHPPGRWYAMAGEAGLLMCSWPKGESQRVRQGFDFYFNECMTGFEYQVAGHMIWEGLVQEGLAIARAIHDRYHASRRNPWNEVECGDHYARAMASYGVFLAACGYEHHGPKGYLAFAPRLSPGDFRAAFTTAEGWGTFSQRRNGGEQTSGIAVKWGKLRLKTLALGRAEGPAPASVKVTVAGRPVESKHAVEKDRILITLAEDANLQAGQAIEVRIA